MARARKAARGKASLGLGGFGPGTAVRHPPAVALFLVLSAAGLAADLWSKHAVFASLLSDPAIEPRARLLAEHYERLRRDPNQPPRVRSLNVPAQVLHDLRLQRDLCPGVRLTLSTNPGVVFGLSVPPWAVVVCTGLTIAFVGCFFAASQAGARWLHVALALVLAGALGNLYDRMLTAVSVPGLDQPIRHQVRDFVDCSQLYYPYVFNAADAWLVIGVGMLILHWWLAGRKGEGRQAASGGGR